MPQHNLRQPLFQAGEVAATKQNTHVTPHQLTTCSLFKQPILSNDPFSSWFVFFDFSFQCSAVLPGKPQHSSLNVEAFYYVHVSTFMTLVAGYNRWI